MMAFEKHVVALKIGLDTLCGKRLFYQENSMFILTKITISLYDAIKELCQEDEALPGDKMKCYVNQESKVVIPLVHACHISRHAAQKQIPPYRLSVAQPVKIEIHYSLIFIDHIQAIKLTKKRTPTQTQNGSSWECSFHMV